MTDKQTPTDAAAPECLTCSDHGAVGNSGFDHKTAADFLSGKTVSDEALRKFVAASRGAHDARAALHAMMLSLQGELAYREAEIALLKRSLLDAEADAAAPQPSPTAQAAEPFCWHWENTFNGGTGTVKKNPETLGINIVHPDHKWTALYTAPQPVAREQLTRERVKEIVRGAGYDQCGIPDTERAAFINGLRHGEQAHGIKGGQHGTE